MTIKVEFKSGLKDITGTNHVTIDSSATGTFETVLKEVIRLYPRLEEEMFYSDGTLDHIYQIIHNSRRLSWPEDKAVRVRDGDTLVFFVFMAGG